MVKGLERLQDTGQMPVGQNKGQIPRHGGFQRGHRGGTGQPVGVGTAALEQVPQPLHHNPSAGEHIP